MCYTLFKAKPAILEHYQKQFDFIQVDECQDTSKVQHHIIQLLASKHQNIYMVADDDQSIYGFRGAFPEAILNIHNYYPKTIQYQLSTNYRSANSIIDLCKGIIQNNEQRHDKNFKSHHQNEAGLSLVYTDTLDDQVNYIIENHKSNEGSQAVLFRNNLSQIAIIDGLDRADVDFVLKDSKHYFFNNWSVQDIISFIKVSLTPNDVAAFERIYYKMNAFLSKVQVQFIKDNYNGINLFETMIQIPDLEPYRVKALKKLKANFEYLSRLQPEMAICFVEDELNYKKYLVEHCKKNGLVVETQNKYLDVLKTIAKHTDSLVVFLERIDALRSIIYSASQNKNPHALKLLTMHASKGLEFDHTIIIDLDHHVFPSKYALDQLDEGNSGLFEEERRLFYVALSRAKDKITLVHTKFRNGQYNKASEFVKEFIDNVPGQCKTSNYAVKSETKATLGFEVGDKLLHTSFGVGYLVDIDGDRIMIEFTNSTKTLSAAICSDSKIIMRID